MDDACDYFLCQPHTVPIRISTTEHLDPAEFVQDDMAWHLESMDEMAWDNGWNADDGNAIETNRDNDEAERALTAALKKWASEHLYGTQWRMSDGGARYVLTDGEFRKATP